MMRQPFRPMRQAKWNILRPMLSRAILLAGLLAICPVAAYAQFEKLVDLLPRSANTVVVLNMEKAKESPMGVRQNWKEKLDKAFEEGMIRVPPHATQFVVASQMDFEFMTPLWEAAVFNVDQDIVMEQIAKARHGRLETIEKLPAIILPNDTYIVQLGPRTLGAIGPANRQMVMRWLREISQPSPPPLSPYLERAGVFSDETGSEIIMAIDLEGVLSQERALAYLNAHQELWKDWRDSASSLAKLLSEVRGMRVGVRIGDQPSARVVVDMQSETAGIATFFKPLLLQVLEDMGASIGDLESWTPKAQGTELSLAGTLTQVGMRRLLSVVDPPSVEDVSTTPAPAAEISPGDLETAKGKATLSYFRSVNGMFRDLHEDVRNAKSIASTQLWFDKYAKRISRLPILNVDDDMVNYADFVANTLGQATGAVKTMGIQSAAAQAQITTTGNDFAVGGYSGYDISGGYRYGAYGVYGNAGGRGVVAQHENLKEVGSERRAVRAQYKAVAASDIQSLRASIVEATREIRREMTRRYNIEF